MIPERLARAVPIEGSRAARVRRLLGVLGLLMLVAMVLPFVVFAVPQTVGADHGFVILSGSMEPRLSPGDVVIVDASAPVGVGDIVTFDDGHEVPTTHRIVDVRDGQYVTKGDANENADSGTVSPASVLGRVTLTIPLIGYLILWANTPLGYVALVLVPIGALLVSELSAWARAEDDPTSDDGEEPSSPAATSGVDREEPTGAGWGDSSPFTPLEDDVTEPVGEAQPSSAAGIQAVDLHLTALTLAVLVVYAAWTLYGQVGGGDPPDPVSVAVLTGAVLGLAGAAWITGRSWLQRHRARSEDAPADAAASGEPVAATAAGLADGDDAPRGEADD